MNDEDYYGKTGCCKTCDEETKEDNEIDDEDRVDDKTCLCYACKCTKCCFYESYGEEEGGHCTH